MTQIILNTESPVMRKDMVCVSLATENIIINITANHTYTHIKPHTVLTTNLSLVDLVDLL